MTTYEVRVTQSECQYWLVDADNEDQAVNLVRQRVIEDDLFIDAELQTISKREPTVDYAMEYGEDSEDLQDLEDSQA